MANEHGDKSISLSQLCVRKNCVIITTHVRSTTGGYVFTGVC